MKAMRKRVHGRQRAGKITEGTVTEAGDRSKHMDLSKSNSEIQSEDNVSKVAVKRNMQNVEGEKLAR